VNRRFAARDQGSMIAALAAEAAPGVDVQMFIQTIVGLDPARQALRAVHEARMRCAIERFPFETVEIVPIG
jgi:hypothetical protein